MGKARRVRTKFHISSVQADFNVSATDPKFSIQNDSIEINRDLTVTGVGINNSNRNDIDLETNLTLENNVAGEWKVVPEDDLFKNLDIDVDKLETSVQDISESRPANISISKCIKRSVADSGINLKLKKGDKRELRRNLFIKKIDAIHQEVLKKKQKISSRKFSEGNCEKQTCEILSEKTCQDKNESTKLPRLKNQSSNRKHLPTDKISRRKRKAASKLKNKTQEMLKNIDFYNQIICDTKYKTDAMGVVTNAVQKKVYADL